MRIVIGNIVSYDGKQIVLSLDEDIRRTLEQQEARQVELRIVDGRTISVKQRGKIFGITRDIARYYGYLEPFEWEEVRGALREDFCEKMELLPFSLSNCEKSVARDFINYLIDFCMHWNVQTTKPLFKYSENFGKCMYLHLEHRSCVVCNAPAQVHHVDAVGMGRDRTEIIHEGMEAVALCERHHGEAHTIGWLTFSKRYHVAGIALDRYLCKKLGLRPA